MPAFPDHHTPCCPPTEPALEDQDLLFRHLQELLGFADHTACYLFEKMVEGRLNKFLGEITLIGQPFVKDPDLTVGKLAADKNAKITAFARLEVGEGIEKKEEDFAAEVKKQAGTSA